MERRASPPAGRARSPSLYQRCSNGRKQPRGLEKREISSHCEMQATRRSNAPSRLKPHSRFFPTTYAHVLPVLALVSAVHEKSCKRGPTAPQHSLSNREEGEPLTALEAHVEGSPRFRP